MIISGRVSILLVPDESNSDLNGGNGAYRFPPSKPRRSPGSKPYKLTTNDTSS